MTWQRQVLRSQAINQSPPHSRLGSQTSAWPSELILWKAFWSACLVVSQPLSQSHASWHLQGPTSRDSWWRSGIIDDLGSRVGQFRCVESRTFFASHTIKRACKMRLQDMDSFWLNLLQCRRFGSVVHFTNFVDASWYIHIYTYLSWSKRLKPKLAASLDVKAKDE